MTITREQYTKDSKNLHQAYYQEIALEAGSLQLPFTIEKIKEALDNGDEHLNSLSLAAWDMEAAAQAHLLRQPLKERGDSYSLGIGVCALKALARYRATKTQ